jgi:predicted small integral membrane protein
LCLSFLALAFWLFLSCEHQGGDPRVGVLGIETTRGDRLFISILGTVFIMLAWLGLYGTPLWGGLAIAIVWWVLVWKKV